MTTNAGVFLESITWQEAERWLTPERVVVIPLGAAAKEHGPHLTLGNDAITANWLAREVCQRLPVVITPLVNTHFYPAFVEYPGSISLRESTARDVIVDICNSLSAFGVQNFYVLNTGVSTEKPLTAAAQQLATNNLKLKFLRLTEAYADLPKTLFSQSHGSHADERETSLMLHIAPETVQMDKAMCDGTEGNGYLSRTPGQGTYSPSGIYGDATLANQDKGRVLAACMLKHICQEINLFKTKFQ